VSLHIQDSLSHNQNIHFEQEALLLKDIHQCIGSYIINCTIQEYHKMYNYSLKCHMFNNDGRQNRKVDMFHFQHFH